MELQLISTPSLDFQVFSVEGYPESPPPPTTTTRFNQSTYYITKTCPPTFFLIGSLNQERKLEALRKKEVDNITDYLARKEDRIEKKKNKNKEPDNERRFLFACDGDNAWINVAMGHDDFSTGLQSLKSGKFCRPLIKKCT